MSWIPGAISAGVGLYEVISNASKDPATTYQPRPSGFSYGGYNIDANGETHYLPNPKTAAPTSGLEATSKQYGGVNPEIAAARGLAGEDRRYLLDKLQEGPSYAAALAYQQAEGIGQRARSMAAGGPFNPATMRNAVNWQAGAAQQMMPGAYAATLQEANQNRLAALNALGQLRGQDVTMLGQEMGLEGSRHNYALGAENALTARYGLNQQDRQFGATMAAEYQKIRAAQGNAQAGLNQQQSLANQQAGTNLGVGLMNAGAAGMAGFGSSGSSGTSGGQPEGYSPSTSSPPGGLPAFDPSLAGTLTPYNPNVDTGYYDSNGNWHPYGKSQSDVRAKTNIRSASPEARQFLDVLAEKGPQGYQYRPEYGGAQSYGPMAQDLEQAGPIGKAMVAKDAQGMRYLKTPDMLKGLTTAVAEQQRQIEELRERTRPTTLRDVAGWIAPQGKAAGEAVRKMRKASEDVFAQLPPVIRAPGAPFPVQPAAAVASRGTGIVPMGPAGGGGGVNPMFIPGGPNADTERWRDPTATLRQEGWSKATGIPMAAFQPGAAGAFADYLAQQGVLREPGWAFQTVPEASVVGAPVAYRTPWWQAGR